MTNLSADGSNRAALGAAGGCEAVAAALKAHAIAHEKIAEWVSSHDSI